MKTYSLATALILASAPLSGCQRQGAEPTTNPSDTQAEATAMMTTADMNSNGAIPDGARTYVATAERDVNDIEDSPNDIDRVPAVIRTPVAANSVEVFIDPTLEDACGIESPKLYFDVDSAEVMNKGDRMMKMLASCLNDHPLEGDPVEITGYADPRGPETYNRALGLERANAVAEVLIDAGVESERIDTYSWGEAKASDEPEDWSTDRKVVVKLDR